MIHKVSDSRLLLIFFVGYFVCSCFILFGFCNIIIIIIITGLLSFMFVMFLHKC